MPIPPIPTDVLLSLLGHELRAPLGVVRGYLRLLDQAGDLGERQQKAVDGGTAGADRISEILEQTSELGRVLRGETGCERTPADADVLLGRAAAMAAVPSDPTVSVVVQAAPGLTLTADEPRLTQAIAALVTALARAQPSAVTLTLAVEATGPRGTRVTISTPSAIPVTAVPMDYSRGGQGLELAMAGALIAAHGGKLEQREADGRFVGFGIELPSEPQR